MAVIADLTCYQGEDFAIDVQLEPEQSIEDWLFRFRVAVDEVSAAADDYVVDLDSVNDPAAFEVIDEDTGLFRVILTSAITGALSVGNHVFGTWRINPGSNAALNKGAFSVDFAP